MATFLEEYTLLEELGQGGFAKVYKVRHNKLDYVRAVRVLNDVITSEQDKTYQRFLDECKILLRLGNGNHPSIVHIYQPLYRAQRALVEMDYIDGCDLKSYVEKEQYLSCAEVMKVLVDIGSALAYCHVDIYKFCMDRDVDNLEDDPNDGTKVLIDEATRRRLIEKYRVIHNDLHTGNIMRRENGNFVLLDFGLAIQAGDVVRSSRRQGGAPEFMSPEKWENESELSTQSDVYSFGVILYNLLAGRVPFPYDGKIPNSQRAIYLVGEAHRNATPEPIFPLRKAAYEATHPDMTLDAPDYPAWLEEVIMKCLEKDPANRFADAGELFDYVQAKLNEQRNEQQRIVERMRSDVNVPVALGADIVEEVKKELSQTRDEMQQLKDEVSMMKQQLHQISDANSHIAAQVKSYHKEVNDMLMQIWSALIFDAADGSDGVIEQGSYEIGDYYNVDGVEGIVFEVDEDGLHGKIVSIEECVTNWCRSKQYEKRIVVGADNTVDGEANVELLMAKEDVHEYPAFESCRELGEGWYLPAVMEMADIYNNFDVINKALEHIGSPLLLLKEYWTSTESNEITAQFIRLDDGKVRGNFKFCNYHVRAVRKF